MEDRVLGLVLSYGWVLVGLVLLVVLLAANKLVLRIFGAVIVPEDSVALVNKKWALFGKNKTLPDGAIIALNGESGWQVDPLPPGLHWGYWPWQYEIKMQQFIAVPEGKLGIVQSRDGKPISEGRVLGNKVECDSFQDSRAFLTNGGQRGPQIAIITPGTYRINTALFTVSLENALEIEDNMVGIVKTEDGKPLPKGEIAGSEIQGHNMFQDAQAFIGNGGFKGLQEQVMLAGRYYINPRFATVELKEMTSVPIAHVGVVISYVGEIGVDLTGDTFKHGNLVSKGQKGVWADPLDPGKYPVNTYTHKVENVPTANVVLNWANEKSESHKLDERLSTITVRSSDGFKFNLDVSQIIHVSRNNAAKVIARFGNMQNLVTQVLEPTIGNYFRNAAQGSDVINFLKERSERQADAKTAIAGALTAYDVQAVDTLIGDIVPPDELMKTLTDRKIAEQEKTTYTTQMEAQETRQELEQAKAKANTQASVVTAERSVEIAEFTAKAAVKTATGAAEAKTINAKADAEVTRVNGEAEAGKVKAIGSAEADVVKMKIASMEASNYASVEITRALAGSGQKLVPEIMAGGGGRAGGGSIVDVLLANLVRDSMNGNGKVLATPSSPRTNKDADTKDQSAPTQ
ncbi:MAG: SPFH domain-containing protein [bacterium]|nr:SPFH domain-containing protein [bacterium]